MVWGMCGIAGYIHLRGEPASAPTLAAMGQLLRHRGPDDSGVLTEQQIGLVHQRLAIVDLSVNGHQPMLSHDKKLALVYNGEVYNHHEIRNELTELGHTFVSTSDTEVVLQAYQQWGPDCVQRFNGMWALALWDANKKALWLSRDRFGVKPLHIAVSERHFVFASEIKAIVGPFPEFRELDRATMRRFLEHGVLDPDGQTFFSRIVSMPAATNKLVDLQGRQKTWRYWSFDLEKAHEHYKNCDPAQTFRELFVDSVRLRLRADVPVGTCLSGGLDSSSIVCVMRKVLQQSNVHVFSSIHQEKEANEEKFIRTVARDTGAILHPVTPDAEGLADDLDKLVWHQEKPATNASYYSQWCVMREAGRHVRVLLDGQGADELLGGYISYFSTYWKSLLLDAKNQRTIQPLLQTFASYPMGRFLGAPHFLSSLVFSRLPGRIQKRLRSRSAHAASSIANALFFADTPSYQAPPAAQVFSDPFLNLLHSQFFENGLPALLHLEDRNSMAFSVEGRLPFTDDHRLVEFCMAMPKNWKIRGATTKFVLRQGLKGILTEQVRRRRRKLGFPTPLAQWLRRSKRLQNLWHEQNWQTCGYLEPQTISLALKSHLQGRDQSALLFRALTAARWHDLFMTPKVLS